MLLVVFNTILRYGCNYGPNANGGYYWRDSSSCIILGFYESGGPKYGLCFCGMAVFQVVYLSSCSEAPTVGGQYLISN